MSKTWKDVVTQQPSPPASRRIGEVGTIHKRNSMKLDGVGEASTAIMSLKENDAPFFQQRPREDFIHNEEVLLEENPMFE